MSPIFTLTITNLTPMMVLAIFRYISRTYTPYRIVPYYLKINIDNISGDKDAEIQSLMDTMDEELRSSTLSPNLFAKSSEVSYVFLLILVLSAN